MKLTPIDPNKLNPPPGTRAIWYKGNDCELFIVVRLSGEVERFNLTHDEVYLRAGSNGILFSGRLNCPERERALKALHEGRVKNQGSILIDDHRGVSEDERLAGIEVVEGCVGLEAELKAWLMNVLKPKES
jgi:hypothetical protein